MTGSKGGNDGGSDGNAGVQGGLEGGVEGGVEGGLGHVGEGGSSGDGGGGEGSGGEGGGGKGGEEIAQASSTYLSSLVRLLPSQVDRAGKQQPLPATSSSAQPPMRMQASLHSSRLI